MERARATWTDERLDDLSRVVEGGFSRIDEDLRSLRTELGTRIDAQGAELGARIDANGAELGGMRTELSARIDAMQRTMLQVGGGIIGAILVAIVSLIATQA